MACRYLASKLRCAKISFWIVGGLKIFVGELDKRDLNQKDILFAFAQIYLSSILDGLIIGYGIFDLGDSIIL